MITELQRSKLVRRFALLDTDADGFVGRTDYERIVDRLTHAFGRDPSSARYRLSEAYIGTWERLRRSMDTDRDGLVSLDEFVYSVGLTITGRGGRFQTVITPMVNTVLSLTDVNRSGRLSRADFHTWFSAYGVRGAELNESFEHLDPDRRGYLTHADMLRFTEEYYCSDDPTALGNWLLGPWRAPDESLQQSNLTGGPHVLIAWR